MIYPSPLPLKDHIKTLDRKSQESFKFVHLMSWSQNYNDNPDEMDSLYIPIHTSEHHPFTYNSDILQALNDATKKGHNQILIAIKTYQDI